MVNNYPYYTAPSYYNPTRYMATEQPQPQIKGRPVTSIEEVRAMTIDFDGSVFFFPDIANKRIYTKQINYDGTSTINTYELVPMPIPATNNSNQYVTKEEFDNLVMRLQQRFAGTELQSARQKAILPEKSSTVAATPQADQNSKAARPQFNF